MQISREKRKKKKKDRKFRPNPTHFAYKKRGMRNWKQIYNVR